MYRTLEDFKAKPVAAERLEQVKRRNKYAFLMELDSAGGVAAALARLVAITGGIEAVEELYAAFDRLTPSDVQEATKKYFDARRRTVMVLRGTE